MFLTNTLNEISASQDLDGAHRATASLWMRIKQPAISFMFALGMAMGAGSAAVAASNDAASGDAATGDSAVPTTEGSPFRDLITVAGDQADVDSHFSNGKWTLVMLWATNCHVCHEQKPMISAAHTERKDIDFTVLGISIDGHDQFKKVKKYIDKNKPSFPNVVGDLTIVAGNYQLLTEETFRGTPTYLLFNPENELMAAQPGRISRDALFEFIDNNS